MQYERQLSMHKSSPLCSMNDSCPRRKKMLRANELSLRRINNSCPCKHSSSSVQKIRHLCSKNGSCPRKGSSSTVQKISLCAVCRMNGSCPCKQSSISVPLTGSCRCPVRLQGGAGTSDDCHGTAGGEHRRRSIKLKWGGCNGAGCTRGCRHKCGEHKCGRACRGRWRRSCEWAAGAGTAG